MTTISLRLGTNMGKLLFVEIFSDVVKRYVMIQSLLAMDMMSLTSCQSSSKLVIIK